VPACFSQYFHFGAQLLPRILARLHDLGNEASGLAIALPDFAAPFVSEMLELCGIGRDRIVSIAASKTVQFTNARVMNPTLDDWQCAPEDLALARTVLSAPAGQPSRRIYLKRPLGSVRSRDRALVNEAELLSIADEFGFEMVDPASMTQREQQQLFSQAKILCGPVGAALTNPGLTLGQDVPFVLVFGNFEPSLVNSRRFPQLPYSVRPADFRTALEAACA
jgi:capsular polysaccharide biosynthesis protein